MGKTTYVICAINMVASAVALYLIFRPAAKPHGLPSSPVAQKAPANTPAPEPAAIWADFERAESAQVAAGIIAKLPASDAACDQAAAYIQLNKHPGGELTDFPRTGRVLACLQFLATYGKWESPYLNLLQSVAADRRCNIIHRDNALRGVMELALRKQAAKADGDDAWRTQLSDFLMKSDFGAETSIEGLALQAAFFAHKQGIIQLDKAHMTMGLRSIFDRQAMVNEATLVAALEVAALTQQSDLADAVRLIAQHPRSEAVLQMAVFSLGKIGTPKDRDWLQQMQPTSPILYRTAETAWLTLGTPAGEPIAQKPPQ